VEPANGQTFQLKELNAIVGGYIEIVATKTGEIMVVNENGHAEGLPFNSLASSYYQGFPPWPILGDVLVCGREQID
jgi:hypothetical protein